MFISFHPGKFAVFMVIIVILCTAVFASVYTNKNSNGYEQALDFLHRGYEQTKYALFFKLPHAAGRASPAAALGTLPPLVTATSTADAVPVLLYHGEGAAANMPIGIFFEHLQALKDAGWHTITLEQFSRFMKGTEKVPAKSFLLTFDDGRVDTFYPADPVLKDLGFTAVMFVIPGFSLPNNGDEPTSRFYLSKRELQYMAASGRWEIESHGSEDHRLYRIPDSVTAASPTFVEGGHFLSNKFWLKDENRIETTAEFTNRVEHDLTSSRDILELDFGKPVTSFAYPLNDFGQDTVNFPASQDILNRLVPSIYSYAFYQTWGSNGDTFNFPDSSAYLVKRIEPAASWSGADLIDHLHNGFPKPLPYTASTFTDGWVVNWGSGAPVNNTLPLVATPDTTGAGALVDGSGGWRDYNLTTTVTGLTGTLLLSGRHTGVATPYVSCAFAEDRIYLEQHEGDTHFTLASAPYTRSTGLHSTFSMSVDGSSASCTAGSVSVSALAPSVPRAGGIGVAVWDPYKGQAKTTVTAVSVTKKVGS